MDFVIWNKTKWQVLEEYQFRAIPIHLLVTNGSRFALVEMTQNGGRLEVRGGYHEPIYFDSLSEAKRAYNDAVRSHNPNFGYILKGNAHVAYGKGTTQTK